jgi:hypothetical protein
METKRFPVTGYAESTIAAYAEEDWTGADGLGDPGIAAVVAAYKAGGGTALVVDPIVASLVIEGLTDLSNTEDEVAEAERKKGAKRDPDRQRHARAACVGLSNLGTRIARSFL